MTDHTLEIKQTMNDALHRLAKVFESKDKEITALQTILTSAEGRVEELTNAAFLFIKRVDLHTDNMVLSVEPQGPKSVYGNCATIGEYSRDFTALLARLNKKGTDDGK